MKILHEKNEVTNKNMSNRILTEYKRKNMIIKR